MFFFFFKQKTAYEMRISDWSSDVCSSDLGDAVQMIHELNQTRDRGLYQEVGKLTRELHSAIVNFQIDPNMPQAEEVSQITDATERLGYVVKLTEAAANRTLDLVESATPQVSGLSDEDQALSTAWGRARKSTRLNSTH